MMTMYVNPAPPHPSDEERAAAEAQARRAQRNRRKFIAQATPWSPGHPSVPFEVIIDNLSDTRVVLVHDRPIDPGMPLLLTVPVGEDGQTKMRQYTVAACSLRRDSKYTITLELTAAPDPQPPEPKRVCSKRLKVLFLLFGIFGLIIAVFAPL